MTEMNEIPLRIDIIEKNDDSPGDGFDILVKFHRLAGVLYLGYGKSVKQWQNVGLIMWGVMVWSWVAIASIPCLLTCVTEKMKNITQTNYYLLHFSFVVFMVSNIFSAVVFTLRGHRFRLLIEDLNKSVVNRKSLKTLKYIVILSIIISFLFIFGKSATFWTQNTVNITYIDWLRVIEDCFSEIIFNQTGLLLIYLSHYISIIIQELNDTIKKSFEFESKEVDFDEFYERIIRIQKYIKRANSLLSPCLIVVFMLNIFFLITFGFFIQISSDSETYFNYTFVCPIASVFALKIFIWCLFVDRMNQKVFQKFSITTNYFN